MKRLLLICILAVCALPLPAQEEEGLFTLERTFELPGIPAKEVQRRAKRWFSLKKEWSSTEYRFSEETFNPYGEWRLFFYSGIDIQSGGKTYDCNLNFVLKIIFDDNRYTVELGELSAYAYKKRGLYKYIFGVHHIKADDSHEYEKFLRKKKMYQLSQDIKAFAATEFEKMLQEIEAVMKLPSAIPLEAFSLYEELW